MGPAANAKDSDLEGAVQRMREGALLSHMIVPLSANSLCLDPAWQSQALLISF